MAMWRHGDSCIPSDCFLDFFQHYGELCLCVVICVVVVVVVVIQISDTAHSCSRSDCTDCFDISC